SRCRWRSPRRCSPVAASRPAATHWKRSSRRWRNSAQEKAAPKGGFPGPYRGRSHGQRIGLVRIELVLLDRAADVLGVDIAFLCQRGQRGVGDPVAADLEELAQVLAGIGATIAVGAQGGERATLGHES